MVGSAITWASWTKLIGYCKWATFALLPHCPKGSTSGIDLFFGDILAIPSCILVKLGFTCFLIKNGFGDILAILSSDLLKLWVTLECGIDQACGIVHTIHHLVDILTPINHMVPLNKKLLCWIEHTMYHFVLHNPNKTHDALWNSGKNNHPAKVFNITWLH